MKRSDHERVVITRRVCNNCVHFVRDDHDTSNECTHGECTQRQYESPVTSELVNLEVSADEYCNLHKRHIGER